MSQFLEKLRLCFLGNEWFKEKKLINDDDGKPLTIDG